MPKSQSLLLAAILLGAQKPNPPRVLRSSLYFIPHRDVGNTKAKLAEGPINGERAYYDKSYASPALSLSFTSVRKDYSETGDTLTATIDFDIAMSYTGIAYPVYTESSPDSLNATIDFDIAMTYTQILFPTYTEVSPDSLTATVDFELTITKS